MSDLQGILKSATESVRIVEDPELRKIAFQEIVRHALRSVDTVGSEVPRPSPVLRRASPKRPPASPRANGGLSVRPEVSHLELSPDEPGLIAWAKIPVDWKKFCWVLEASRLKNVDGLTNSEISYLIDKVFRESYTPDVVNNLKVQIKKGMVKSVVIRSDDREYRVWKILASGIQEVAAKPTGKAE